MENITFWLLFNPVIDLCLFIFALCYAKKIYLQLAACVLYAWNPKISQLFINLFSVVSFWLYVLTGGIVSYKFAVSVAILVLEITEYSNPVTESAVVAVLGLLIFKQLSTVIENFLSDLTKNMFLNVYHEI